MKNLPGNSFFLVRKFHEVNLDKIKGRGSIFYDGLYFYAGLVVNGVESIADNFLDKEFLDGIKAMKKFIKDNYFLADNSFFRL